jgi:N-acetyltransferase 10
MASTINGYEGTGRSLSLKLIQQLREQSRGYLGKAPKTTSDEVGTTITRDGKPTMHPSLNHCVSSRSLLKEKFQNKRLSTVYHEVNEQMVI